MTYYSDFQCFVYIIFEYHCLSRMCYCGIILYQRVTKIFLMGPTGITKTSLAPYGSSGREWSISVTWSPTSNQAGYHLVCFNAEINSKYVLYNVPRSQLQKNMQDLGLSSFIFLVISCHFRLSSSMICIDLMKGSKSTFNVMNKKETSFTKFKIFLYCD